jgi:NTE family protein
MLFHAGAFLRIAEVGLLPDLACVSGVSGGSIAAAVLARCWAGAPGPPSVDRLREEVVAPLLALTRHYVDVPAFIRGLLPGRSPGGEFATVLDRLLLGGMTLGDLPDQPEFVFNATNLNTGVLWRFSKGFVGDYVVGGGPGLGIRLSTAVAASSAFPPFFAPLTLHPRDLIERPDADEAALPARVDLGDGGIYDNLGLETAWKRFATVLVSDGGGAFRVEGRSGLNPLGLMYRVTSVIDHQVRSLRSRALIAGYVQGERTGAYWGIRTQVSHYPDPSNLAPTPEQTAPLAAVATRMRPLDATLARRLVNWGYAVSDSALRSHLLPSIGPASYPFPDEGVAD